MHAHEEMVGYEVNRAMGEGEVHKKMKEGDMHEVVEGSNMHFATQATNILKVGAHENATQMVNKDAAEEETS